ncbi:Fanconi anemia group I protein homolog [Thrips palmi]|uniref:Fanconi anemia group I protein homolog n=1 Tax=Thrips palmi TaxID=161013 RepID=A0A6P8YCS4_THRPL|nr:Fanconi anemia group I protein homolog [Thrips palmi]
MDKKIVNLINCGKNGDLKELQQCVESFDVDEIGPLISKTFLKDEFRQLFGLFLDGLTQSGLSHQLRYQITEQVLHEFEKHDIPLAKANLVTSRLKLEVSNFSANNLVKLCDLCMKTICEQRVDEQRGSHNQSSRSHMCWKELLPTMLLLLIERKRVTQHGTQMTGEEYKSQLVKTLCQSPWKPQIASSLASMLINIPLSPDEHLQVVNKLCCSMEELPPQELPTLVHEMLELCKDRHGLLLLMKLNHYFHLHLYKNRRQNSNDMASSQMLESENIEVASFEDTKQALGTVLYHVNKVAGCYASIKDFVNTMAKVAKGAPEAVLQPIIVSMLFSIATVSTYEDQVFSILRTSITRGVLEMEKRKESAWMRDIRINKVNIQELINTLIDCCKDGQLGVEEGLVNLAFELLRVPLIRGKEAASDQVWHFGTFILLRLMRYQRHVANSVLQRLCDCIITGEGVQQYIKCLGQMCRDVRLVIMEQQSAIVGLLSYLRVIQWNVARDIVIAVMPIVLLASGVRDNLILVLRKALFSRDTNTRKVAVHGFIEMLKNLRLEAGSLGHLSQGSSSNTFSGYNILSQVSVEVYSQATATNTNTKEAICLEVLGALRGCLNQQAEVRVSLYKGLFEVVESNPPLTATILFWLRGHLLKQCDLDALPPVRFNNIITLQAADAILQEPVGALLYLIQQVVLVINEREDDVDSRTMSQVTEVLDKLVVGMGQCTLENFELDEDVRLMDSSVENKRAAETLRQALAVYEALMCYCINTWSLNTPDQGSKLLSMYKCYTRLIDYAKNATTGGNNKKDVTMAATGKSQTEKKGRFGRPATFKLPPSILGLPFLSRTLDLLHMEDIPWSTAPAAACVKGKREFHRYVMNVLVQNVAHLREELQCGNMSAMKHCAKVARKIYEHCICRLSEIDAFDRNLAILILESFLELLQMVLAHCRLKWTGFLQIMTGVSEKDGVAEQLQPIVEKLMSLLDERLSDEDDSEDEVADKKLIQHLSSALQVVSMQLPTDSPQCIQLLEKMRALCSERSVKNLNVAKTLVQLLLKLTVRCKAESQMLPNLTKQLQEEIGILPDVQEEELTDAQKLNLLNTATKYGVLGVVCATIKGRLEEVEWVAVRLDAELTMLEYSPDEETADTNKELLRTKERETVCHMARCVQCNVSLSVCAPQAGPSADVLLRIHCDAFDTLSRLTKYFIRRSSKDNKVFETARFDKVIRNAGKYLARNMFAFVSHIGEKKSADKRKKKNLDPSIQKSKVLRETRLIPSLVRKKETFDQCVIKLSKDCKAPELVDIVKHNSARDFSLKPQAIKKALRDNANGTSDNEEEEEEEGEEEGAEEADEERPASSNRDDSGNESESGENGDSGARESEDLFAESASDDEAPARKKSRRSD